MSDEQTTATLPELSQEIKEAARQAGGGWLDEVVGNHTPPAPLSAVRGASVPLHSTLASMIAPSSAW